MDAAGGGGGVNPDCPNAANPFHRCAAYCPVPAPKSASPAAAAAVAARGKPSPPRPRPTATAVAVAQNGTAKHGDGALTLAAARVVPAADANDEDDEDGGETEESPAVNPAGTETSPRAYAAQQNGTAPRRDDEEGECEITVVDDSEERSQSAEDYGRGEEEEASGGRTRTRRSARSPAADGEAAAAGGGERRWGAVNPDCPNAANPFHRCAKYCPVPVPFPVSKEPPTPGSTHSDPGAAPNPRPRRRDKGAGSGGGSGGLPLYVFLREGFSDGDGKRVDPRCSNAPNPFHVCTDHCLVKILENGGRSSEGAKSPISLFSRHSRRSSSSSEDGSVKSGGSRKVDLKCPNAGNPFHECGEHCKAKMQQAEQHKGGNIKSPRTKGGKNAAVIPNWKVDPRCPNAGNPFHMCAQYCFDHLNGTAQTSATKSDQRRDKDISKDEGRREVDPDCVNASNPYHKCGDHCKRKGGKDISKDEGRREIDPDCVNASNPYHKCGDHCKRKGDKDNSKYEGREVNPDCVNASNPYHKCGDHCKRHGDR